MNDVELEYVGFWLRVGAAIIDSFLVAVICWPIVTWIYGPAYWMPDEISFFFVGPADFLVNGVLPSVAIILFWIYRQATPGKMAIGARIVDAKTGGKPSTGQMIGRYFGYYLSILPLCLGLIWVGIDQRKQGFHDMLAGTVVVRPKTSGKTVKFE